MTQKRLFIIVFIFAFIDFLIATLYSFFSLASAHPSVLEEGWIKAFDTFAKLQFIYEISRLPLFFGLIYFFCTPKDLSSEYKKIIMKILVGTIVGGIAGFGYGSLALITHRWVKEIGRSKYIKSVIITISMPIVKAPFNNLFAGFTAITLSYLRRRKFDSKTDEVMKNQILK